MTDSGIGSGSGRGRGEESEERGRGSDNRERRGRSRTGLYVRDNLQRAWRAVSPARRRHDEPPAARADHTIGESSSAAAGRPPSGYHGQTWRGEELGTTERSNPQVSREPASPASSVPSYRTVGSTMEEGDLMFGESAEDGGYQPGMFGNFGRHGNNGNNGNNGHGGNNANNGNHGHGGTISRMTVDDRSSTHSSRNGDSGGGQR